MRLKSSFSILLISVASNFVATAQTAPFTVALETIDITGLGGIQSYAYGQHNGQWLIVGGRLDGLHRRQPFAAFDVAGHNNQLIVIDPVTLQKWSAPVATLPTAIQEQLSATNMQFHQEGDYLYCLGGYGFSATANDHITYPNLTAIKVSDVINAIKSSSSFTTYFRQITDTKFEVTGGQLKKINNDYYLMGGQKFIGRYNPMGPTSGPGFVQEYTNAIRKFSLTDDGTSITISHLPSYFDTANLHRRDYNAESQILPSGEEGITMFSGVFQQAVDLPFLNSVTIDSTKYVVNNVFQQYYNHYHCASLPIYSASANTMHNVFFGGIAQYYDSLGIMVHDNNVPFVKTIARVSRDASGTMAEYKLPIEMPTLLGAGSELIPNETVPQYRNGVFKLDDFTADSTLVGYIYGGISSTAANIFFINTGTQSSASSQIFKVYVVKNKVGIDELNKQSISTLKMQVYPNPNDGNFEVIFNLKNTSDVNIIIQNANGKLIENTVLKNLPTGANSYSKKVRGLTKGGAYFISIETKDEKATQKVIIDN